MSITEKELEYITEQEINQLIIESRFNSEIKEYRYYISKSNKIAGV